MEMEPSPTSPAPLIQAEHSYSLSEEPRAQSPFTHVTNSDSFNDGKLRAGALAPLNQSNLRVWSVGYSTVSTSSSVCSFVLGLRGNAERHRAHFSTPACVLWERAVSE